MVDSKLYKRILYHLFGQQMTCKPLIMHNSNKRNLFLSANAYLDRNFPEFDGDFIRNEPN